MKPARPVDPSINDAWLSRGAPTVQTLLEAFKSVQPAPGLSKEDLAEVLKAVQPQQGFTKDDLAEVLANNAEGVRRSLRPENNRHPDVSVFNPQGERDHPRAKLIHSQVFEANIAVNHDDLDHEEIALMNQFTHTKTARNGQWRAEVKKTSDGGTTLHLLFPCSTVDDRMDLPRSLKLIMTELLGGEQAVDPLALGERVRALEAQLAAKK